jgi:hypothetical protein
MYPAYVKAETMVNPEALVAASKFGKAKPMNLKSCVVARPEIKFDEQEDEESLGGVLESSHEVQHNSKVRDLEEHDWNVGNDLGEDKGRWMMESEVLVFG